MPSLFDPLVINRMELRNRFFRSATLDIFGYQGMVSESLLSFYVELARGEIGLIFTGGIFPKREGQLGRGQLGAHIDETIPGLQSLVRVVHESGGKIAAQLMHSGMLCSPEVTGFQPEGPSSFVNNNGHQVRELLKDEVYEIVEFFVQAGRRVIEAGFDAVQIHGAHSHLISSFLSPAINTREDEWGGSPENRAKLVVQIYRGLRKLAGDAYPILIKYGLLDYHPMGKSLSEGVDAARSLEIEGMDAIEVSEGFEEERVHHIRLGAMSPYYVSECRQAREVLSLPLILVGGMRTLQQMQAALDEEVADGISMCRPFIMDPHIIRAFRDGSATESKCISCNECLEKAKEGDISCTNK
jgi:2,4-dienoyl-CoA reductase-like NADH-dependent reductase (Old Yellow Enzyme family)